MTTARTERNDIVTKRRKVIELDPLLECTNCDCRGNLEYEYHSPSISTCVDCTGTGRLDEDAEGFVWRMVEDAPDEPAVMRTQRLLAAMAKLLEHLEREECEVRQDAREILANHLVPGSLTTWDSSRDHSVDVLTTGEYRTL